MYEWDENNNQANIRNHGLSFEEAIEAFNDPYCVELYAEAHSTENEDRYICIGSVGSYLILFVVFTDRNGNTRIISARKATSDEEEFYYENIRRTFE